MAKQSFSRRVFFPLALVMGVWILSSLLYSMSRHMERQSLHLLAAHIGAIGMFLSLWLGALWGNTIAFFRGASFGERMVVCLATPVVWCATILSGFIGIFSIGEFLFLFLHHFIIGCPLVALLCMGLSEVGCRVFARWKTRDPRIKIFALSNVSLLVGSFVAVFLMLWRGGHAYYYLYMDVYTQLFL